MISKKPPEALLEDDLKSVGAYPSGALAFPPKDSRAKKKMEGCRMQQQQLLQQLLFKSEYIVFSMLYDFKLYVIALVMLKHTFL